MSDPRSIGLALGGGGARGLAHIGVLKALERHRVPIDILTGSSMGSVVGAMYAATVDAGWVEERFKELLESEVFEESGINLVKPETPSDEPGFLEWAARYLRDKIILSFSSSRQGLVRSERLSRAIEFLLPVRSFQELRLPFACTGLDVHTGRDVLLNDGDLVEAVTASSSIPGYLPPVDTKNGLLVDGGAGMPVPGVAARNLGAAFVIGVDVSIQEFRPLKQQNILGILGRVSEIMTVKLTESQGNQGDYTIYPDTLNLHWSQFDRIEELVASGERAVEECLDDLQAKIRSQSGMRAFFRRIFS